MLVTVLLFNPDTVTNTLYPVPTPAPKGHVILVVLATLAVTVLTTASAEVNNLQVAGDEKSVPVTVSDPVDVGMVPVYFYLVNNCTKMIEEYSRKR